jgi:neutral ceramidase
VPKSGTIAEAWRFGAASVDITSAAPQFIPAYFPPRLSQGVYHPLHAKSLYITDGQTEAAVIAADLCIFSGELAAHFRRAISSASGVAAGNIVLSATHTHTGPQISLYPFETGGAPDPAYLTFLEKSFADALRTAKLRARPGRVEFSRVRSRLGVNRRQMRDGKAAFLPNPEGSHDRAADTRWILDRNGRLIATLTSYGCHATVMGGPNLGADYPGYFKDLMEKRTGAVALWCAACGADVRPWFSGMVTGFGGGTPDHAKQMGYAHAREVLAGRRRAFPVELGRLRISRRMVTLPIQKPWTLRQLRTILYKGTIEGYGPKFLTLAAEMRHTRTASCEVQVLSLNAGHHLVYLGGEACTEIGIGLKDLCPGQIVTPHGYANSMVGYIPSEHMFPQGGHEVVADCFSFGLPASFVPDVQERLWSAALSMIDAAAKAC